MNISPSASHRLVIGLVLPAALLLAACMGGEPSLAQSPTAAAIAVPDSYAARVATDTLTAGGNAVDAAVAVAFSLAVTYPEAGNLGGGGFMLAWIDGRAAFLDYRETAPQAATRDMYLDKDGTVLSEASLTGRLAAGVPGTVAGLYEAHRLHGKLSWSAVVAPAIALAADGFVVPPQLQARIAEERDRLSQTNYWKYFGGARTGEVFRQPELAQTLRAIAANGHDGFYGGDVARLIASDVHQGGGLLTEKDLADYRPIWRKPLQVKWRDREILAAPPPSSGGFALVQLLKMKDALAAAFAGVAHNSPQYIHLVAEISKRVFADRAEYLGDPDFHRVPITDLLRRGLPRPPCRPG